MSVSLCIGSASSFSSNVINTGTRFTVMKGFVAYGLILESGSHRFLGKAVLFSYGIPKRFRPRWDGGNRDIQRASTRIKNKQYLWNGIIH